MTDEQIKEAITQVKHHCDMLMTNYESTTLRGALYTLGYSSEAQAQEVIEYCASHGFNYCLDTTIKHNDGEYPPAFATMWGPDQLKSRLECLSA